MSKKKYQDDNVLDAAKKRISQTFDDFERVYISFSGGKDSTVMMHLVMDEAIKRKRKVGVFIVDLEAQYFDTIKHIEKMIDTYKSNIDLHWFCGELLLRNAVSNYEPKWCCWDEEKRADWVREKPSLASDLGQYDFYIPKMEFEEIIVLFGEWYSNGKPCAAFIGIRSDESLNRYKAITSKKHGLMHKERQWTTKVSGDLYNIYPIYDWRTEDIWTYHSAFKEKPHNEIYDKMTMAGVKISDQRLCQPYGDDQKKGLWLYHILEPETWYKLVARVNGVNSGALYSKERGSINGVNKISKPETHTWQSFCNLLLATLPKKTRDNYVFRFKKFIHCWRDRGYSIIPDEAPIELENRCWAPSWRRMCRCILRNDYYCKGLGQTQPKSEAWGKFKDIKQNRKEAV